ncbi:MAG TPA: menaquinol oxidoreductase [Thermodesulfobacteriota bacterium]|nr:menaquinol oxidoreductase [Thermodesulfobacteriota bacterium]
MIEKGDDKVFVKDPNKSYGIMEIVDGTSPMVEKAPEDTVETFPHYIILLTISSLAVTFALLIVSLFLDAPLEDLANPLVTPNPGKAPWYFTGIQELIHYTNKPVIPAIIIPLLIVAWLIMIPYVDRKPTTRFMTLFNRIFIGGEKRRVLVYLFTLFVFGALIFTLIGSLFRGENWGFVYPWK